MTSRKVFLTHSREAARLLAEAHNVGKDGVTQLGCGCANNMDFIPSIYHDRDYFYCLVETESDRESYDLIIC